MTDAVADTLEPYRDISGSGRAHDPWVRRGILLVLGLLVLAALLNRFGQLPSARTQRRQLPRWRCSRPTTCAAD
jgi:hypothetical protein